MGREIASMLGGAMIAIALVGGTLGFGLGIAVFRTSDNSACVEFIAPKDAP